MKIWMPAFFTVIIQPIVFGLLLLPRIIASSGSSSLHGIELLVFSILAISSAIVLLIWIPTFILIVKFNIHNWFSILFAGFTIGMSIVIPSWPTRIEGYTSSYNWYGQLVQFYRDGEPTIYAWYSYFQNLFNFGMHGLIGAFIFYKIWMYLSYRQNQNSLHKIG